MTYFCYSISVILKNAHNTSLPEEQLAMRYPLRKRDLFQQVISLYLIFGIIFLSALISEVHLI